MIGEELFLFLFLRSIVGIQIGQSQPQGTLVVAQAPGFANPLARETQRTESLIVEVIWQAGFTHDPDCLLCVRDLGFCHVAHRQFELVGSNLAGLKRLCGLTEIPQVERLLLQILLRPVMNRDVLSRDRVPVFEPAVADPLSRNPPAIDDRADGFRRPDRPLRQSIKRVRTLADLDVGLFVNLKVFRNATQLHAGTFSIWTQGLLRNAAAVSSQLPAA